MQPIYAKKNDFWGIFLAWPPVSSLWPVKRVKRLQKASKNMIFTNWLDTRPKMLNAWTKCLINHFGGCFARFLDSILRFGHSKCHFFALENGHFWQKCPFSRAKKWHFERPNLRTESKNLAKHPPKWFIRHLVHAFSIFGRVSSQFLKIMFLEAFYPLKRPKTRNRWPSEENAPKIFFFRINGLHIYRTKLY